MPAVSRLGDSMACGDVVIQGSNNVFINGMPVGRLGDGTAGHADWVPNAMSEGSPTVFANNIKICRVGDKHVGHLNIRGNSFHRTALAVGSPNVFSG